MDFKKFATIAEDSRNLAAALIEHASEIQKLIDIEPRGGFWPGSLGFRAASGGEMIKDIIKCEISIHEITSTEARMASTREAECLTGELCLFIETVIDAGIEPKLKAAIANHFNLFGYLSDRSPENIIRCRKDLQHLEKRVRHFLGTLSAVELQEWETWAPPAAADKLNTHFRYFAEVIGPA